MGGKGVDFFYCGAGGGEGLCFFFSPPSFDMCKEEGKQVSFFRRTFFFIIEWPGKGARVFFKKYIC